MAAQKKLPMMMAYMRYDHAVVIEQTVLSGLTEEQAMFYFVTSFSVFLVDWAGGSCQNLGIARTMEVIHRFVLRSRCKANLTLTPGTQAFLAKLYMINDQ